MPVSREEAFAIASRAVAEEGRTVSHVRDLDITDLAEGRGPGSLVNYGQTFDWLAVWIAYLIPTPPFGLRSSMIVVIDKATGEVRYRGSAYDEG